MNTYPSESPSPTGDSLRAERKSHLGGLVVRKERWCLTLRGWLLGTGLILACGFFVALTIHPFLAPTERLPAKLLVVEGWSPPSAMRTVITEYRSGNYDQVILVRPLFDVPDDYESGRSYGMWLVHLLVTNGVPESKLAVLFPKVTHKDRTYHSALVVKEWISAHQPTVDALNLATTGPHARRSRLLYEKAFASKVKIGVIAMQSPGYDPHRWWQTSAGVREIIGETIAYVYARIFFRAVDMTSNN